MLKFIPTLLIGLMLCICSCSKEATYIDIHERYPIDQLPTGVLDRSKEFALKNNVGVDFLQGARDTYMVRFTLLRKSEMTPSQEELNKVYQNEIIPLSKDVFKGIFLGQPILTFNCALVVFHVQYKDNGAVFPFY